MPPATRPAALLPGSSLAGLVYQRLGDIGASPESTNLRPMVNLPPDTGVIQHKDSRNPPFSLARMDFCTKIFRVP